MNIILLEIYSDEANLENEKVAELLERILDLILKFSEVKSN